MLPTRKTEGGCMLLKIAECVFIVICFLFVFSLILNKIYIVNLKDNLKKSDYVASIALLLAIYVLSAIMVCIFIPNVHKKTVMMLFALSPFIIGKLATYEKEKFYTAIQIICIITSFIFVIILG